MHRNLVSPSISRTTRLDKRTLWLLSAVAMGRSGAWILTGWSFDFIYVERLFWIFRLQITRTFSLGCVCASYFNYEIWFWYSLHFSVNLIFWFNINFDYCVTYLLFLKSGVKKMSMWINNFQSRRIEIQQKIDVAGANFLSYHFYCTVILWQFLVSRSIFCFWNLDWF